LTLPRTVSPETLDVLAPSDARAVRSRRDLQRVNRVLGTRGIIIRGLEPVMAKCSRDRPLRVLELGAGDGSLMLRIARKLSASCPLVHLTLLDRLPLIGAETSVAFARLGWSVQTLCVDVLDWTTAPHTLPRWDAIVTNHFLHHFENQLPKLLSAVAARCNLFVACEPRRSLPALIGSYLIGTLGANRVTREDAVLSVHAGFRDAELSTVWPRDHDWQLQEHAAGLFSHSFRATKCGISVGAMA